MPLLKVYTASAGSGKTHSLTREYLSLVLNKEKGKNIFKNIQAVTFTNKATEEMKSRILEELFLISQHGTDGKSSPFFTDLLEGLKYSAQELKQQAETVLQAILQDYSAFRIKTIDAFFQEVLRCLARELGLQGNFRPVIETEQIFEQAVLGILTDLDNPNIKEEDKTSLKNLVKDLVQSLIQEGKSSDPRKEIRKLISELAKEEVQLFQEEGLLMSSHELKEYKKHCLNKQKTLLKELKSYPDFIVKKLIDLGLLDESLSDFSFLKYKDKSGFALFIKLYKMLPWELSRELSKLDLLPKRFLDGLEDQATLINKDYHHKLVELESSGILEKMQEYKALVEDSNFVKTLISLKLILDFVDSYSFILKIDEKVKEIQKEDNLILLKDTSRLINKMLKDKSGVYFLYEKLGTKILHHMIDEFQDTSRLQYENFKPLLEESLSKDMTSLIVGDVKQSIYRFRNSDSSLLREQVNKDFYSEVELINLDHNWRSEAEIINFNNHLYSVLPKLITESFQEKMKDLPIDKHRLSPNIFKDYYADNELRQEVGRVGAGGLVVVYEGEEESRKAQSENEDENEDKDRTVPKHFLEAIANLQERGYKASDIAILVRQKSEASLVAEALSTEQTKTKAEGSAISYDFVSSEALQLEHTQSIKFLIKALNYMANPNSLLARLQLRETYQALNKDKNKLHLFTEEDSKEFEQLREFGYRGLYEALEQIFEHYSELIPKSEVAYQIKLLDLAYNFQQNKSANIADFIKMYEERGKRETIVSPEDSNKLVLMTAHKSKGLGFPVVLIPFASWTVMPKSGFVNNFLWEDAPFIEEIGIKDARKLPIKYSGKLNKSFFAAGMYEEQIRTALDELNLLYVATTRAKTELHLWYPKKTQKESIATWLKPYFENHKEGYIAFDEAKTFAEQGINLQATKKQNPKDATSSIKIEQVKSYNINGRITDLGQGLEHFEEDNPRLYGNMMHHILSKVTTIEDVEEAVDSAVAQGFLSYSDASKTKLNMRQWLNSLEDYKRWFDGSAKVLNERAIIGTEDGLRRPDRVLIYESEGRVEIVDYKFGKYSSRSHSRYEDQLKGYRKLLLAMGYVDVKAYIWYVRLGSIKEVLPSSSARG